MRQAPVSTGRRWQSPVLQSSRRFNASTKPRLITLDARTRYAGASLRRLVALGNQHIDNVSYGIIIAKAVPAFHASYPTPADQIDKVPLGHSGLMLDLQKWGSASNTQQAQHKD